MKVHFRQIMIALISLSFFAFGTAEARYTKYQNLSQNQFSQYQNQSANPAQQSYQKKYSNQQYQTRHHHHYQQQSANQNYNQQIQQNLNQPNQAPNSQQMINGKTINLAYWGGVRCKWVGYWKHGHFIRTHKVCCKWVGKYWKHGHWVGGHKKCWVVR